MQRKNNATAAHLAIMTRLRRPTYITSLYILDAIALSRATKEHSSTMNCQVAEEICHDQFHQFLDVEAILLDISHNSMCVQLISKTLESRIGCEARH